jgi:putative nucleotidyltransferase with HDIG domain
MNRFQSLVSAFFRGLANASLTDAEIDFLRENLTKQEQILFYRMSQFDQKHSLLVAHTIEEILGRRAKMKIEKLFKAALLHDVGKVCVKLTLWDRVIQTVSFAALRPIANYLADRGQSEHAGHLSRILYCSKYHPQIGAELAREIGVEESIVYLIQHHEDLLDPNEPKELTILREADSVH